MFSTVIPSRTFSQKGLKPSDYHLQPSEKLHEAVSRSWSRMTGAWNAFATALEALPGGGAIVRFDP